MIILIKHLYNLSISVILFLVFNFRIQTHEDSFGTFGELKMSLI